MARSDAPGQSRDGGDVLRRGWRAIRRSRAARQAGAGRQARRAEPAAVAAAPGGRGPGGQGGGGHPGPAGGAAGAGGASGAGGAGGAITANGGGGAGRPRIPAARIPAARPPAASTGAGGARAVDGGSVATRRWTARPVRCADRLVPQSPHPAGCESSGGGSAAKAHLRHDGGELRPIPTLCFVIDPATLAVVTLGAACHATERLRHRPRRLSVMGRDRWQRTRSARSISPRERPCPARSMASCPTRRTWQPGDQTVGAVTFLGEARGASCSPCSPIESSITVSFDHG